MTNLTRLGTSALITGTVASIATTAALALLARTEGKGAVQRTNSTSHWLHGQEAGSIGEVDAAHTLIGYGTHHISAIFWALPFEAWLATRPTRTAGQTLTDATMMSAIAAVVDYGMAPRRLTPGWEKVLSKRSIAATYAAMALGLAAGALISQRGRRALALGRSEPNRAFGVQVSYPKYDGGEVRRRPLVIVARDEREAELMAVRASGSSQANADTLRELTPDEVVEYGLDLRVHGDMKGLPALNL